ncbi:MAG: FUSC family protein [Candidatus Nanopelagicales bacterium]
MTLITKPKPGTPKFAAIILAAVLVPSFVATAIGGQYAGMAFGIAAGFVMAVAPMSHTGAAAASAVLAAALAAVSNVAGNTPWAIAVLMLVSALLLGLTNQHSAGLMTLAPIIVIIFGPGPVQLDWWQAGAWTLAGGMIGLIIVKVLKFEAPPRPTPAAVAWRHALVLGILSAATMYWALANGISHGYWVTVTIIVALRPMPEERGETLKGRLLGTALGALVALPIVLFLPQMAAAALAAVFLFLLAAYSMGGNYFMQTLFLTPMLLVFASLGDPQKGFTITVERVYYTVIGIVVGVAAAFLLDRWDSRDTERVAVQEQ